jgi:predicted nuclease of predicted toxin-antitoxin system
LRFLANENFLGSVIRELRVGGHDVLSAKETMPGADDSQILSRAQSEGRVRLTFDKDFGELAVRSGVREPCGVVLSRLRGATRDADRARAIAALASRNDWPGHFAVVTETAITMRRMPGSGPAKV